MFPLLLYTAPRDYVWVQQWNEVIEDTAFIYGDISPDSERRGFIYFEVNRSSFELDDDFFENWGVVGAVMKGQEAIRFILDN